MEAKELRIGNLLQDKVSKTLLEVIELTKEDIITYVVDRSLFPLKKGWGLEPIPITEDWLSKFGFDKAGDSTVFKDTGVIEIGIIKHLKKHRFYLQIHSVNITLSHIEYVHQLQNLYFALTGEELILKTK